MSIEVLYRMLSQQATGKFFTTAKLPCCNVTSYTLTGLLADTYYQIILRLHNSNTYSDSMLQTVKTFNRPLASSNCIINLQTLLCFIVTSSNTAASTIATSMVSSTISDTTTTISYSSSGINVLPTIIPITCKYVNIMFNHFYIQLILPFCSN